MMKIVTLEDIVNHNADIMTKALKSLKSAHKNIFLLAVADILIAYLFYAHEKDLKSIKEDIRVMKAEILLDENEIKVLREQLNKEKAEKES